MNDTTAQMNSPDEEPGPAARPALMMLARLFDTTLPMLDPMRDPSVDVRANLAGWMLANQAEARSLFGETHAPESLAAQAIAVVRDLYQSFGHLLSGEALAGEADVVDALTTWAAQQTPAFGQLLGEATPRLVRSVDGMYYGEEGWGPLDEASVFFFALPAAIYDGTGATDVEWSIVDVSEALRAAAHAREASIAPRG